MSTELQFVRDQLWSHFSTDNFDKYSNEFMPGSIQILDMTEISESNYIKLFNENCTISTGIHKSSTEVYMFIVRRRPSSFHDQTKIWKMTFRVDTTSVKVITIPCEEDSLNQTYTLFSNNLDSVIWTLSDQVPNGRIWKCIESQYKNKLAKMMISATNKKRTFDTSKLPIPSRKNIQMHFGKSISADDVNSLKYNEYMFKYFYHGITKEASYRIVGLFISAYAYLNITIKLNKETNNLEIASISVVNTIDDVKASKNREEAEDQEDETSTGEYNQFGGSGKLMARDQITSLHEVGKLYIDKAVKSYNDKSTKLRASGFGQTRRCTNLLTIPMRPNTFKEKFESLVYPMIVMTKIDGVRAMLMFVRGKWRVYSRTGLTLFNVDSLMRLAKKFPPIMKQYILNLEVYYDNSTLGAISGALNSNVPPKNHEARVNYALFDMTPINKQYPIIIHDSENNILKKTADGPASHKNRLANVLEASKWFQTQKDKAFRMVCAVRMKVVNNEHQLKQYYKDIITMNGEGVVMVLNKDALFAPGRCNTMFKWKSTVDIEVKIIDIIGGQGKNSAQGVVKFVWNGKEYKGSIQGDAALRESILINRKKYKDTIATCRYTGTTTESTIRTPIIVAFNVSK